MDVAIFKIQMARLSLMFHPGKFKNDEGEMLFNEYWQAINGERRDTHDFIKTVNWLMQNYNSDNGQPFFPQPAKINELLDLYAKQRYLSRPRLPLPELKIEQNPPRDRVQDFLQALRKKKLLTRKGELGPSVTCKACSKVINIEDAYIFTFKNIPECERTYCKKEECLKALDKFKKLYSLEE